MAGKQDTIRIEINRSSLAKALNNHSITAAEIRCLDTASKQQLWQLCLQACSVR